MNIEKMREDFKAWAMKDFGLRDGHFVEEDGEFANYPTHCYWLVWQASRESLAPVFEQVFRDGWNASGEGWNAEYPGDAHEKESWQEDFSESMHRAGVKTK